MIRLICLALALALLAGCPDTPPRQTTLTFDAMDDPMGWALFLDGTEVVQVPGGGIHQFAVDPGTYAANAVAWDGRTADLAIPLVIEPHSQHTVYVVPPVNGGDNTMLVLIP